MKFWTKILNFQYISPDYFIFVLYFVYQPPEYIWSCNPCFLSSSRVLVPSFARVFNVQNGCKGWYDTCGKNIHLLPWFCIIIRYHLWSSSSPFVIIIICRHCHPSSRSSFVSTRIRHRHQRPSSSSVIIISVCHHHPPSSSASHHHPSSSSACVITPTNEVTWVLCGQRWKGFLFVCALCHVTLCGTAPGGDGSAVTAAGHRYSGTMQVNTTFDVFRPSRRLNYRVLTKVHYIKVVPLSILHLWTFFLPKFFWPKKCKKMGLRVPRIWIPCACLCACRSDEIWKIV